MDRVIADISKKAQEPVKGKKLFSKVQPNGISDYTKELNTKCFVCERIEDTFKRYGVYIWTLNIREKIL